MAAPLVKNVAQPVVVVVEKCAADHRLERVSVRADAVLEGELGFGGLDDVLELNGRGGRPFPGLPSRHARWANPPRLPRALDEKRPGFQGCHL